VSEEDICPLLKYLANPFTMGLNDVFEIYSSFFIACSLVVSQGVM